MNEPNNAGHGGVPAVRANTEEVVEARPSGEQLGVSFSDLGEATITRSRAIKLAGAALAGGALSVLWAGEAEASPAQRRRRRRRRLRARRRRQAAVVSNPTTVNFGGTTVGTPTTQPVQVTNNGTTPVTLSPTVVGDGFMLADTGDITLAPGETATVPVTFNPLQEGVSTGELRLVDTRDGLLLETVDLSGTGVGVTAPVTAP